MALYTFFCIVLYYIVHVTTQPDYTPTYRSINRFQRKVLQKLPIVWCLIEL